jgi:TolB-like protein
MKGVSFSELKRRNVFRVAAAYAVGAWVVVQAAGLGADAFEAPAWVMQMTITALIIGFVPAIILAWAFELTPEGIRRERDLIDHDSVSRYTAKRLDIAVIFLLVLAIALIVGDRYLGTSPGSSSPARATVSAEWVLDSIAVLPFADFSPARDQSWLGEGIADTLLHALAQVEGLSVSARSSSFAYRGRDADVATIGRELGVATVLEGSVQRLGERLRVSAQLVRTDTQAQLFSRTFERETDDIFAIQDEIALAVTNALLGSAGSAPAISSRTEVSVYDLYLEGRQLWQERTADSINSAVSLLEQAVTADPDFAPAQAELAIALMFQVLYADVPVEENRDAIERQVQRALGLDPDNALAWATRGHLLEELGLRSDSLDALRRAERLDPGNANIQIWVGNRLYALGRFAEAAGYFERALELDPLNPFVRQRFMATLGNLNSTDPRIERIARDSVRLFPELETSWFGLLNLLSGQDRIDELVLTAHEAHLRFPETVGFIQFKVMGLQLLGLREAAERWQLEVDRLGPEDEGWLNLHLFEYDPEAHLALARSHHQRHGDHSVPGLLQSLRFNGHFEEAHALFLSQYERVKVRFENNEAALHDYGLLFEGIVLAHRKGDEATADYLAGLVAEKLDEFRGSEILGSLVVPDLHLATARGDLERSRQLLQELPAEAWNYYALLLRLDPDLADFARTPEAQRIIEQASQQTEAQRSRLLAQAPEGLLN